MARLDGRLPKPPAAGTKSDAEGVCVAARTGGAGAGTEAAIGTAGGVAGTGKASTTSFKGGEARREIGFGRISVAM